MPKRQTKKRQTKQAADMSATESDSDIFAEPKPRPDSEPESDPELTAQPDSKSEPEPDSKSEPDADSQPEPDAEPDSQPEPDAEPEERKMKARGTKAEVWAGEARRTAGGLFKHELTLNRHGKPVSLAKSLIGQARFAANREAMTAARAKTRAARAKAQEKAAKEAPPSRVLYFGAGLDMSPLSNRKYKKHNRFLFVEQRPKITSLAPGIPGYEPTKDPASMLASVKEAALTKGFKYTGRVGNLLKFEKGYRTLEYWMSTTLEEAQKKPEIAQRIRSAKCVHVRKFDPWANGLAQSLRPASARP